MLLQFFGSVSLSETFQSSKPDWRVFHHHSATNNLHFDLTALQTCDPQKYPPVTLPPFPPHAKAKKALRVIGPSTLYSTPILKAYCTSTHQLPRITSPTGRYFLKKKKKHRCTCLFSDKSEGIVLLSSENLDVALGLESPGVQPASASELVPESATIAVQPQQKLTADNTTSNEDNEIAEIQVCGHVLHNSCLREWTGKANSCPICRQNFHLVNVYDKVGGTKLSSYAVEDKKQIVEFDAQAWLDENPEDEEPARSCPICESNDHEEVLLLCDSCDAPYHTYCVGLDEVPRGHWFCMECSQDAAELLVAELRDPSSEGYAMPDFVEGRSHYMPRTQANMRRDRRRARSDEWQGAWGQIAGRVFDALNLDLDNHDDDEALQNYRRSQRRSERERQEYQRWQQRLNIASRFGARDVFTSHLPQVLPQPQPVQQPPPPPQETAEEKRAWGAFEKAMEAIESNDQSSNSRKRKSRSASASPRDPPPEPERKLKRPRTRRVPHHNEASSSSTNQQQFHESSAAPVAQITQPALVQDAAAQPSFLSTLLKEVEMSTPSDDENIRCLFGTSKSVAEASSPATSPSPSGYSSPRALSTTPPPRGINERPGSPLSLMSRIEPVYPPANFSPNRNAGDHSDSETRARRQHHNHNHGHHGGQHNAEIRQPRPRRHQPFNINTTNHASQSPESSPTRGSLTLETKENLSNIIKAALKPHYKSGTITADQYTAINRDLSRKLYKEMTDEALSHEARNRYERLAAKEVAKAVADLGVNRNNKATEIDNINTNNVQV